MGKEKTDPNPNDHTKDFLWRLFAKGNRRKKGCYPEVYWAQKSWGTKTSQNKEQESALPESHSPGRPVRRGSIRHCPFFSFFPPLLPGLRMANTSADTMKQSIERLPRSGSGDHCRGSKVDDQAHQESLDAEDPSPALLVIERKGEGWGDRERGVGSGREEEGRSKGSYALEP